jgi:hypothetical protein
MATAFANELTALVCCGLTVTILECDRPWTNLELNHRSVMFSNPIYSLRNCPNLND